MIKDHVVANELYNYQLMNMWHVHIYNMYNHNNCICINL